MNCSKIQELLLTDYRDGFVFKEIGIKVESHLKNCKNCRDFTVKMNSAIDILKQAGSVEPEKEVWITLKEKIIAQELNKNSLLLTFKNWVFLFWENLKTIRKPVLAYGISFILVLALIGFWQKDIFRQKQYALNEDYTQFYSELDDIAQTDYDFGTAIEEMLL